jgi:hypothetical protein
MDGKTIGTNRTTVRLCANELPHLAKHAVSAISNVSCSNSHRLSFANIAPGVRLQGSDRCEYCAERERPCVRANAYKFRHVKTVKFNAGENVGSSEQSLEFEPDQPWAQITRTCMISHCGPRVHSLTEA